MTKNVLPILFLFNFNLSPVFVTFFFLTNVEWYCVGSWCICPSRRCGWPCWENPELLYAGSSIWNSFCVEGYRAGGRLVFVYSFYSFIPPSPQLCASKNSCFPHLAFTSIHIGVTKICYLLLQYVLNLIVVIIVIAVASPYIYILNILFFSNYLKGNSQICKLLWIEVEKDVHYQLYLRMLCSLRICFIIQCLKNFVSSEIWLTSKL